jgi:hypothetical protein
MLQLGIEGGLFEAAPRDQLLTFMLPIYDPWLRILGFTKRRSATRESLHQDVGKRLSSLYLDSLQSPGIEAQQRKHSRRDLPCSNR